MTINDKQDLIKSLTEVLEAIIVVDEAQTTKSAEGDSVEMLTIKECSKTFKGVSEHAIRQLITQNKIPYIRVGASKRGKILIAKNDFLNFLRTTK